MLLILGEGFWLALQQTKPLLLVLLHSIAKIRYRSLVLLELGGVAGLQRLCLLPDKGCAVGLLHMSAELGSCNWSAPLKTKAPGLAAEVWCGRV